LILALFATYIYFQVERSLIAQVDAALDLVASQALLLVGESDGALTFQGSAQNPEAARGLSDDFVVMLLAEDGRMLDTLSSDTEIVLFPTGTPGYSTQTIAGDTWRVYRRAVQTGETSGWIETAQELDLVVLTLASLRSQIFWVVPLGLLLAGLGGYFLATRALRPIDEISRIAQASSASDLSLRINYHGPKDEVGRLAQTFDRLLERLESAFARERQLTADAAHELRTPLAALKGRIGVTLSRQRQLPEYHATLKGMEEQVDRLIRLTSDLLFMARLEGGQLERQTELIEVDHFLGAIYDQVKPLVDAKAIALVAEAPTGLAVRADFSLLTRLFLILLDNAVKNTPPLGKIHIQGKSIGSRIEFSIQDSGPGIPVEHIPYVFDRFYRVQGDRSRAPGDPGEEGAGLGLAIAREIAGTLGGELSVETAAGRGAKFIVILPSGAEASAG
jgi:signal transduction histidine kinase